MRKGQAIISLKKKFCKLGQRNKTRCNQKYETQFIAIFQLLFHLSFVFVIMFVTIVLILLLYLGFVHIFTICYYLLCYYCALCYYLLLCYFVCCYCAHCYYSTWVLCTCNWIRMNTTGKNFISGIVVNIHINIYSHGH